VLDQPNRTAPPLPRRRFINGASAPAEARAWTPAVSRPDTAEREVERLRKRVRQQEKSLAALSEAVIALRTGGAALREENRELRLQLQKARRTAATVEP
jgi:small-conductance mechanosensitive channel